MISSKVHRWLALAIAVSAVLCLCSGASAADAGVTSITVTPNPFTPTGCNNLTVAVKANPNQTGLMADIENPNNRQYSSLYLSLTESPTGSGTYVTQWNGCEPNYSTIELSNRSASVWIVNASHASVSNKSQTFALLGIRSVAASPKPFDPVAGQSTTITASTDRTTPVTGLHLGAIVEDATGVVLRMLPMSEAPAGTYKCSWDGKDSNGIVQNTGSYTVYVYNADCSSDTAYSTSAAIDIRPSTVGQAKLHPNGSVVALNGKVVTAVFPDCFYIEEDNRSGGLKVVSSPLVEAGDQVNITGTMDTNLERQLTADSVEWVGYEQQPPAPLFTLGRNLGGAANGLCPGVTGGIGLDNTGLLVKCVGVVTSVGNGFFYIKDGSTNYSGSGYPAVKVTCDPSAVPQAQVPVEVVGIVSCEQVGVSVRPILRVRSITDITVIGLADTVSSITVTPDPFIPTGCNTVAITVKAFPNQTDLSATLYNSSVPYDNSYLSLTETPIGSGKYVAQWNGVDTATGHQLEPGGQLTVSVSDSHTYSAVTQTFRMRSISQVTASPGDFCPLLGQITTITATTDPSAPISGLHLEALVGGTPATRVLPMTEGPAGTYKCSWDGKDHGGVIQPLGSYHVCIQNTDCNSGVQYNCSTYVNIITGVKSIEISPDLFIPTGCSQATVTVSASPNQQGMIAEICDSGSDFYYNVWVGMTETPVGSGTYVALWNGVDPYSHLIEPDNDRVTVDVVDYADVHSQLVKTFRLHGIASMTASPEIFDTSIGQSTTITAYTNSASPVTGLSLGARIEDAAGYVIRILPMTENTAGTYQCTWDGRDSSGGAQRPGSCYTIRICNTSCGNTPYSPSALVYSGSPTIGLAKRHLDGSQVALYGKVVTAVFPDCFYVEEEDRSSGIKVVSSYPVEAGDRVDIMGSLGINLERQLTGVIATNSGHETTPAPLFMPVRSLGGAANGLCPGVTGGTGLNNIGLLVKCAGTVTSAGSGYFYLNDGSLNYDGSLNTAMKVRCDPSVVPKVGALVKAVGIVSCEQSGSLVLPIIRLRSNADLVVLGG